MARSAAPKSRSHFVLAADLGGTKLAMAALDREGALLARRSEPVDLSSPRAPLEQIVRLDGELAAGRKPRAIGVAVPGLARPDGSVWAPNLPGWEKFPLRRELEKRLGIPAVVESDRNAVVLGETWRGAARNRSDVIVLIVGTGIGAGILSGGRLIRGAHELSGCAGWMVVTEEAGEGWKSCGSLESLAAGPALGKAFGGGTEGADLAARARGGDAKARAVFERAGTLLGYAVANLISLFDPEIIVLTGGTTGSADLYLDELRRAALERAQPLSAPKVKIVVSKLGERANLFGAGSLAWGIVARPPRPRPGGRSRSK